MSKLLIRASLFRGARLTTLSSYHAHRVNWKQLTAHLAAKCWLSSSYAALESRFLFSPRREQLLIGFRSTVASADAVGPLPISRDFSSPYFRASPVGLLGGSLYGVRHRRARPSPHRMVGAAAGHFQAGSCFMRRLRPAPGSGHIPTRPFASLIDRPAQHDDTMQCRALSTITWRRRRLFAAQLGRFLDA